MKAKYLIRRITAFIIDYIFISILASILVYPLPYLSDYFNSLDEFSTKYSSTLITDPTASNTALENEILNDMLSLFDGIVLYSIVMLFLFILYYVIFAGILGNRTLGCVLTSQKIMKVNSSNVSKSDLTIRMLLNNFGIIYLVTAITFVLLESTPMIAITIFSIFIILYVGFLIVNVILLFVNYTSLVDTISKTRPLLLVKTNQLKK